MDLSKWIYFHGYDIKSFAKRLGYSYRYIFGVVKREYIPSKRLAKIIEKRTLGDIRAIDLIYPSQHLRKP